MESISSGPPLHLWVSQRTFQSNLAKWFWHHSLPWRAAALCLSTTYHHPTKKYKCLLSSLHSVPRPWLLCNLCPSSAWHPLDLANNMDKLSIEQIMLQILTQLHMLPNNMDKLSNSTKHVMHTSFELHVSFFSTEICTLMKQQSFCFEYAQLPQLPTSFLFWW